MSDAPLTALQWHLLRVVGRGVPQVFLTGGGALAGFHLRHRPTTDLDFFSVDDVIDDVLRLLRASTSDAGAPLSVELRQRGPDFARVVVSLGADSVALDIVRDRVPQLVADKPRVDGVAVDPLEEILVNKLTALVGRQEERDLVDVWFIERQGLRVEDALAAALAKDGGCTPATLAWLLSTFPVPPDHRLPPPLTHDVLNAYRQQLIARFARQAASP